MSKILATNCECQDPSHLMRFELVEQALTGNVNLYVNVQLNSHVSLWKRIWYAAQYIAGKKSRFGYGLWDCGSIGPESARELQRLINAYLSADKKPLALDIVGQ